MSSAPLPAPVDTESAEVDLAVMTRSQAAQIKVLENQVDVLKHQLDWFKRQLFGEKSERVVAVDPQQMPLIETDGSPATAPAERIVPAHTRRVARSKRDERSDAAPFFDESRVPVQTIAVMTPEMDGLDPDAFEVIGEKISYRLAQRPASYVVLKYVRPVIKRRDTQTLHCAPAPPGVLEGSRADVSFCAGLLTNKFLYHLPLYRQHQQLSDSGITVSRPWLTQLAQQIIALLRPIYSAQLDSIRQSRVIAMDETPIKAGREKAGKLKQGYFWPVYGERDEVCFPYSPSRGHRTIIDTLGLARGSDTVLLTDGYAAYERYAKLSGITHARCWAHCRREFFEAQNADPAAAEALERIRALYTIEEQIREQKLAGESKRLHRLRHSKPNVEQFFDWIECQFERQGLLPSSPFTKALAYARERRAGLEVFLLDPDVPLDTNHLERSLRPIPMRRRNWLFCWSELGAEHVGIVQSLLITCRLQGVDPYTYLVDVLQRISQHPAANVDELTPRLWKERFADNPLRSDVYNAVV